MALNFPANPSTGDVHNASNNLSYFFDGVKWITQGLYNTGTINTVKLDSLTSSFNGSLTTFNLTSNSNSVKPPNAESVMISLGGVIQEPTTAYTINSETGTITFASAPASNTAFFGIVYSRLPQSGTLTASGIVALVADQTIAPSEIDMEDNEKIKLGNNDDLSLFHNGTDSKITNNSGSLFIEPKSGETGIKIIPDGGVELYHDAALKLETINSGISVSGVLINDDIPQLNFIDNNHDTRYRFDANAGVLQLKISINNGTSYFNSIGIDDDNNILIPDNHKINIGAGNDLVIVHNGAESKITNKTGNLFIEAKDAETGIKIIPDGSVELYHNNVKKAETSADGFDVTGNITCTGNIDLPDGSDIKLGDSDEFRIFHDDSNGLNFIQAHNNGPLIIKGSSGEIAKFVPGGEVSLRHNNSTKLETTSSGITVTGSVTTQDMNMSNLNGTANEVDNTKGSWSIQEGADDLFLINRVSGKKYKFNLTEIS